MKPHAQTLEDTSQGIFFILLERAREMERTRVYQCVLYWQADISGDADRMRSALKAARYYRLHVVDMTARAIGVASR